MIGILQILLIFVTAIGGAVFAATLGWLESGEPFNPRKFVPSIMRAVVSGIIFVLGFGLADLIITTPGQLAIICFSVFVGGAGIDVLGHRVTGTIKPTTG